MKSIELMEAAASAYYTTNNDGDAYHREDAFTTMLPSADDFESEKIINPSDIKKIKNATTTTTMTSSGSSNGGADDDVASTKPNNTELSIEASDSHQKFSKLFFSSPSAQIVTSSGPSVSLLFALCLLALIRFHFIIFLHSFSGSIQSHHLS